MNEISEAAQEYGRVRSEVSSPEDYARAAQGLIDEALRRVFSAIQIRPVAPGPLSSSVPEVPPSTVFRGVKVETYDNSPPPTDAEAQAVFHAPQEPEPAPSSPPDEVKTRYPVFVDKDGDVWHGAPGVEAAEKYGPLTPVICVRDPARKEVK